MNIHTYVYTYPGAPYVATLKVYHNGNSDMNLLLGDNYFWVTADIRSCVTSFLKGDGLIRRSTDNDQTWNVSTGRASSDGNEGYRMFNQSKDQVHFDFRRV